MPLVNFTPRVSVRRMCTPSRMRFAMSVRRISPMISSSAGMSAEAGMGRITVPDGLLDTLGASAADRSGHRS
ncbi:hypothetical protein [Candidatus Palauibacter sp.]|uniref:hypothetical protein n=1 Tax=Candidatus Palauibacter sp. TaxID=3101350 RepID=UPI003C6F5397